MNKNKLRDFAKLVGICSILTMLGWCQKQEVENIQPIDSQNEISIWTTEKNIQTDVIVEEKTTKQKLVINTWCVGCRHCVMFAPNNFAMNERQAYVTSQDDLDSISIQNAISRCKANVIKIVDV